MFVVVRGWVEGGVGWVGVGAELGPAGLGRAVGGGVSGATCAALAALSGTLPCSTVPMRGSLAVHPHHAVPPPAHPQVALRWFCSRSLLRHEGVTKELIDRIPGKQTDRKVGRGGQRAVWVGGCVWGGGWHMFCARV